MFSSKIAPEANVEFEGTKSTRLVQPANIYAGITVIAVLFVVSVSYATFVKDVQFSNRCDPSSVVATGICIVNKDSQPANT